MPIENRIWRLDEKVERVKYAPMPYLPSSEHRIELKHKLHDSMSLTT